MNIPLNIDWQQILLHWMNLAILTGGLYFLLFKPVKQFMEKREAHYKDLDAQAAGKLQEAERVKAEYQARLAGAEEEIHQSRIKAQAAVQQSAEEQLAQAQAQAKQIIAHAQAEAEHSRERVMRESQKELRKLAAEAARKLAVQADPFSQFLDLAEGGRHEER
ncbi:MAG: ATP synthase F0 subunit B [Oscillibacter sp.]|nr:ATP synthase F0 subunit B [Oscillibacter sp.]MCI9511579.1 ATP synthase F0 subunit B [Oscillibacter sp.]